ncbi:bactofilin family protein [Wenxinia saemankumensis]|uniref:Polymer-forming protein n=1 Tax=Wenxinia saemankumensis TaxID=1447782 RepID=A0A1M6E1A6_9RHOB|nr:polymer-forming cytoskeletal protein [Wenxinia saemankumensis]SHI79292.1 Polymer-forming protein [Wenxinia saemankumensis]
MSKTTISEELTIEGDVTGQGTIDVRGTVIGDIRAGGIDVLVGGRVEGRVTVDSAEVRGILKGGLQTRTLNLYSQAEVEADVSAETMSAERGARLKGRVTIG